MRLRRLGAEETLEVDSNDIGRLVRLGNSCRRWWSQEAVHGEEHEMCVGVELCGEDQDSRVSNAERRKRRFRRLRRERREARAAFEEDVEMLGRAEGGLCWWVARWRIRLQLLIGRLT